jgi:hypothetical protein
LSIQYFGLLVAVLGGLNGSLRAQMSDPFFAGTQFTQWSREAPVDQIPWKLHLSQGLTTFQRIVSSLRISVDGRYFNQRPNSGDLVALLQVSDRAGHVYQDHLSEFLDSAIPNLRKGVSVRWRAFMLPGDYELAIALYDKSTGKHSFTRRNLRIQPLTKDPLPDAWRDLPAVEFLQFPSTQPETSFHRELSGRLHLPLTPRRPVRVELLANLSGTGWAEVSHSGYDFNLGAVVPIVKTFTQMEIGNGALNVEFFDLVRRRVAFRQDDAHDLDWERLRPAIAATDPSTLDVHALQDTKHTAAFLRKEVAEHLKSGAGPADALAVLVLISSAAFFDRLDDINDTLLPTQCGCVVYYIRYNALNLSFHLVISDFDNVQKVLKPLPVHTRVAQTPLDLRRTMAEIMDEISKM